MTQFPAKSEDPHLMKEEILDVCRSLDSKICMPIQFIHQIDNQIDHVKFNIFEIQNDPNMASFIKCNKTNFTIIRFHGLVKSCSLFFLYFFFNFKHKQGVIFGMKRYDITLYRDKAFLK